MTYIIPQNIDFKSWANQLRNSYPDNNIPIVSNENDWTNFPSMLLSNRCFEDKNIPLVVGFTNWRDWASEFLLSIGA